MLVIALFAPFIDAARGRDKNWCSTISCEHADPVRQNHIQTNCPVKCSSQATGSANTTVTTHTASTTTTATIMAAALANVCKCVHGYPVTSENCSRHTAHECQFCFLGFHLDEESKHCVVNVCKCDHGAPVSNAECFLHGATKCNRRSCMPGFHFESGDCEANECVCRNGSPGHHMSCSKNGAHVCDKCIGNYHLSGETEKVCEANVCTCVHGYPVTRENCRTHMVNECQWCFPGFYLDETTKYCEVATTTTTTTTTTATTTRAAISNCSCPNIDYYHFSGNYYRKYYGLKHYSDGMVKTRTNGRSENVYYYFKFTGDIASSKTSSTLPFRTEYLSNENTDHKCYYTHNSSLIYDPYDENYQKTDYKFVFDFDWQKCYHRFVLLSNDYDNSHCCCCSKAIVR